MQIASADLSGYAARRLFRPVWCRVVRKCLLSRSQSGRDFVAPWKLATREDEYEDGDLEKKKKKKKKKKKDIDWSKADQQSAMNSFSPFFLSCFQKTNTYPLTYKVPANLPKHKTPTPYPL